ncbi:hypothetical protein [Maricaulis maris]|uniref:hypothetical protein n=1 Tax=Maricaulis maris TaxID=74318 RepID=UPI003B8CB34A
MSKIFYEIDDNDDVLRLVSFDSVDGLSREALSDFPLAKSSLLEAAFPADESFCLESSEGPIFSTITEAEFARVWELAAPSD